MSKARVRIGVGVLALIALAVLWYFVANNCTDVLPPQDAPQVLVKERSEFLSAARHLYRTRNVNPNLTDLRKPLSVKISGKLATLRVDAAMNPGQLYYAQAWQRIYIEHRGGHSCVTLRVEWNRGHVDQPFPPTDL